MPGCMASFIIHQRKDLIELFLRLGHEISTPQDTDFGSVLEYSPSLAVLDYLLEKGASPRGHPQARWTPLYRMLFNCATPDMVSRLLEAGADPNKSRNTVPTTSSYEAVRIQAYFHLIQRLPGNTTLGGVAIALCL